MIFVNIFITSGLFAATGLTDHQLYIFVGSYFLISQNSMADQPTIPLR